MALLDALRTFYTLAARRSFSRPSPTAFSRAGLHGGRHMAADESPPTLDELFAPPPALRPPRLPFAIGVPQNQPVVPRRGALAMRRDDDVCEVCRCCSATKAGTRHCNKL